MITGSGPGAGKTTLAERLRAAFEDRHCTARLWPEKALFKWEILADLADRFRRREYPSADDLIGVLSHVLSSADSDLTWIQDWSWVDIAEDLPWAAHDLSALDTFSRRAHAAAVHLQPVVLYLSADIPAALDRAVRQRGERWLARRGTFEAVAASYVLRETRIRHAITAGGWPCIDIHVHSDADRVLAEARTALRLTDNDSTS